MLEGERDKYCHMIEDEYIGCFPVKKKKEKKGTTKFIN